MIANGILLQAAIRLCQEPEFLDTIAHHCRHVVGHSNIARLNTRVHPNDQMLQHSLRHFGEVNQSVSQYFSVALQQDYAAKQLLQLLFDGNPDIDILDFACGYGRFLRLLVLGTHPTHIWASEIQHDAVDYATKELGVHGIYSDVDPNRFTPGKTFHFIWVASLFSHLPEHLFHQWLTRLMSVLRPDGVLCFSVHDELLLPGNMKLPANGIHFLPESENQNLDQNAYGTTYVSESFVARAIDRACRTYSSGNVVARAMHRAWKRKHPYFRVARGLANHQDFYVVPKDPHLNLDHLHGFRRGAWGCVDLVRQTASGLYIAGWAASLDNSTIHAVEITVDGRMHTCHTGISREDVREALGNPRFAHAGWEITVPLPTGSSAVFVTVKARTPEGEQALLYIGRVELVRLS